MKTKPDDVEYCGVNREKILTAVPKLDPVVFEYWKEFIQERYLVHVAKDVLRLPPPWTENVIFKEIKFTNVRREHDRQTKAYMELIGNSNADRFNKFWNTILFRMFNLDTVFRDLAGGYFDIKTLSQIAVQDEIRAKMKSLELEGKKLFTNAFNVGGLKQSLALPDNDFDTCKQQRDGGLLLTLNDGRVVNYKKERERLLSGEIESKDFEAYMPMRIIRYVANAANNLMPDLHNEVFEASSQLEAYTSMLKIRGVSRFLSYQMFVDLTYCPEFKFSENEFTVSGPGCDAGLELLFADKAGMNSAECIFWLRDNQHTFNLELDDLMYDLDPSDRTMNVMSLENTMCELSKFYRCKVAISVGKKPRGKVSTALLVSNIGKVEQKKVSETKPKTKKLW